MSRVRRLLARKGRTRALDPTEDDYRIVRGFYERSRTLGVVVLTPTERDSYRRVRYAWLVAEIDRLRAEREAGRAG